jgi:hypothetical protein
MRYTLLGEDLWKYVTEGVNPLNLLEFGITKHNFHQKSTEGSQRCNTRVHGK